MRILFDVFNMTLNEYIVRSLGKTPQEQAINFLAKPFGAPTFTEFWQYWNPVWSYYLRFYCYRPLRKFFSRAPAALATFLVCGLAHDLPIGALAYFSTGRPPLFTLTVFFALIGALMLFTEKIRFQFAFVPVGFRWVIHVAVLALFFQLAVWMTARQG